MISEINSTIEKITALQKELLREYNILKNQVINAKKSGLRFEDIENKLVELEKIENEINSFFLS